MDEKAVEFIGDYWKEEEKKEIYGMIEKSDGHLFSYPNYNNWKFLKTYDNFYITIRYMWEFGAIEKPTYKEFIKALNEYLNWE